MGVTVFSALGVTLYTFEVPLGTHPNEKGWDLWDPNIGGRAEGLNK